MERRCGNCLHYTPEESEIGSGGCIEISKLLNPGVEKTYDPVPVISVLAADLECSGASWTLGKMNIITCPACNGQGHVDIEQKLFLGGNPESWTNFFDVMFNMRTTIERVDGESIGNFWAFVQHLKSQFG